MAENRSLASQHLALQLNLKRQELRYCSFLIENCLYLVWCHLDYYMLRSLPRGFPQVVPSPVLTQGQFLIIMLNHAMVTLKCVSKISYYMSYNTIWKSACYSVQKLCCVFFFPLKHNFWMKKINKNISQNKIKFAIWYKFPQAKKIAHNQN